MHARVAALAVLSVAGMAVAKTCARSYIVQLGDTCDSISAANNVSTFQLSTKVYNVNSIDAGCQGLYSGELLCLGLAGLDCTQTHVVQSGDYCGSIADAAGINTTTLLYNNPNVAKDCSNIYLDEVLCVSNSVIYTHAA